jgi:DNA invertase Pin-like site-specific DNA recombinase
MAGIAAFERELMLERQGHRIAVAKAVRKYCGRAPAARAHVAKVAVLKAQGEGVPEIVRLMGISRASYYRILSANSPTELSPGARSDRHGSEAFASDTGGDNR